ncbi:quinol:cytochrome c oxidoreductase membrane protein [Mariniphaga anaerophila]|uniref:Quinol:cytochrome c oxidoreductase membrane protein n=1 Tax=Mariniphaga anaerophila TaxID=1484053 RepID=A0A1M5DBR7_9BACT|nr:DUF3341 domain-containing protein [Mariniphaga anaerophila]SHF64473.1 quinol:cytochrome c oxidoreductase membrane protein [Mariniphaga anaerophila]
MGAIVYGHFTDELDLLNAVKELKNKKIHIADVRTPFPVHGLDTALKYPRSHLPKIAFAAGLIGGSLGLLFQIWVFTKGWPLNFGGKPYLSIPSFIPVTFELTVLFAAFAMGIAFLLRSNLGPGKIPNILDDDVTNDHFQVILAAKNNNLSEIELAEALEAAGAIDVKQVNATT